MLGALRRGFVERRSEEQQRAVLAFLLKAIEAAEPEKKESPAHLCWEWRYHRLRLELEPDAALRRLSELAAGPLGRAIRAELGRAVAPGQAGPDDVGSAVIPLRALPGTRRGLQRLLALAQNCGVSHREAYPVGGGHTVAVSACGFGGVALSGAALWLYLQTGVYIRIDMPDTLKRISITLDRRAPDGWHQERSFPESGPTSPGPKSPDTGAADKTLQVEWALDPGSVYRVRVFAEGQVVDRRLGPVSQTQAIDFKPEDSLVPCTETIPDIGLVVDRCPAAGPVGAIEITPWAESPDAGTTNRLMSIGLEVRTDAAEYPVLDKLAAALLKTGSLDLLYRVRPATDGNIHLQEVFDRIKAYHGPSLEKTQLIAWSAGQDAAGQDLAGFGIDRALLLGQGADASWVQPLLDLLSSETTRITEAEVLEVVKTATASGSGAPVVLLAGEARIVSRSAPPALVGVFRDTLKDGSKGPAMVEIPALTFSMGDSQGDGDPDERPVHEVEIDAPFALGQVEVTVAEFRQFVEATGDRTEDDCLSWSSGVFGYKKDASWRNPGFGQDDGHPVVCVSWNDARTYAQWLSEQTGHAYRLPTEAEWEYAARAGTETSYWWNNEFSRNRANCDGCGSHWDGKSTAPGGSFAANPYRVHDTAGNAWEWVEDCWHEDYAGAPTDGSVWTVAECAQRVIRGGSWFNLPTHLRSANRGRSTPDYRIDFVGFRLARTLDGQVPAATSAAK